MGATETKTRRKRWRGRALKQRNGPVDVRSRTWALVHKLVPADTVRILRVQDAWPRLTREFARGRLVDNSWPARIDDDTLLVHVHDNQWLHEFNYYRQAIQARLVADDPSSGIKKIRARLAPRRAADDIPAPPPKPAPQPEGRATLTEEPDAATTCALAAVHDESLKHLLARVRVMLGRTPARNRQGG